MTHVDRRTFLRSAAKYTAGGAILAPSLSGLIACNDVASTAPGLEPRLANARLGEGGYGGLVEDRRLPFLVPRQFNLRQISRAGDPMAGNPGQMVPNAFDGMGCFAMADGTLRLVRNHEIRDAAAVATPIGSKPYDTKGGAGTTTLQLAFDAEEEPRVVKEWVSISGTCVNCAGGVTPRGSWLTCEETSEGASPTGRAKNHGYVFEVPAAADGEVDPVPLAAMGRFAHEAVAIDPATDIVYLTEDDGSNSGFYRFIPHNAADYTQGGTLQMLAVAGQDKFDTRNQGASGPTVPVLSPLPVRWVTIQNPDPADLTVQANRVYFQGYNQGGARFARLEGAWYGDRSIFFDATSGGQAGAGQIWQYVPSLEQLVLLFESPSPTVLDAPDNICVSPRGGIVICEDGGGTQFLRGLTPDGRIFDFVRAADPADATEFAGACFSPDGKYLFFNTQGSTSSTGTERGSTFAIWGPTTTGAL